MRFNFNRRGGRYASLLALFPFGLVILGAILMIKWMKNSVGIDGFLDKTLGISNLGATTVNNKSNDDMIAQAKKDLSKKGVDITAMDRTLANNIFTLINKQEASDLYKQLYSSSLSE